MSENKIITIEGKEVEVKPFNIQGDIYYTTFTRKYENRKSWSKPNDKEVLSYIPGTVKEVLIKEGDIVVAEQKIAVLEAMKMLNTIYSPLTGKIKSVKIKTGDRIPKGIVMIEFE
jgi:biotin carboxyl carrier protein